MTVTVAAGADPVLRAATCILGGVDALLAGHLTAGAPALRPVFGKLAGVDVHLHLLLEKGQRFALGLFLPGEHGVEECAVGLGECGEGGIELLGLLPYAVGVASCFGGLLPAFLFNGIEGGRAIGGVVFADSHKILSFYIFNTYI